MATVISDQGDSEQQQKIIRGKGDNTERRVHQEDTTIPHVHVEIAAPTQ